MRAWIVLAGLGIGLPTLACGPNFPVTLLDQRESTMLDLPDGVFAYEAARLLSRPDESFAVVEPGWWVDEEQQRQEAEALGLIQAQVQRLVALRDAPDLISVQALAGDLQPELAHYASGAWAWQRGDLELALQHFQAVGELAPDQSRLRGVWAAYMEGRTLAQLEQPDAAIAAFARARTLAAAGAQDPLGLAVASFGEQARVEFRRGRAAQAVRLYAEQAAFGSVSGRNSLLFMARAANTDSALSEQLLADPVGLRLLTIYLYSRSNELIEQGADDDYPSFDARPDNPRLLRLLDRLAAQAGAMPDPERLAAVAYRAGRFEQAATLAGTSTAPLAAWVRAKLALRAGDLGAAAAAYAQAAQGFPANERWQPAALPGEEVYDDGSSLRPQCRVQAEAGTLALSQGDYQQALELLYAAAEEYWTDAAYIAERVVETDQLKAFVDRVAAQPAPPPANVDPSDYWERRSHTPEAKLRWLLARRLMREGRRDDALAYFDDPQVRAAASAYRDAHGATNAWGRITRARAWFEAAGLARWHGMELMGYEGDPDYFEWGGNFDLNSPMTWDENYQPVWHARQDLQVIGPYTSDDERRRVAASRAQPLERFHYRLVAAGHAGAAADLLPARSQAFAAVLCEATRWLIDRQPEQAQGLYRRYLREGAYVPWGERFGRECPQPDFAKVETELRQQQIAQVQRVALWSVPLLLAAAGLAWWRRRQRQATQARRPA